MGLTIQLADLSNFIQLVDTSQPVKPTIMASKKLQLK